jgi:ATP-binding cassette, subfamily B, bacterial MsbA
MKNLVRILKYVPAYKSHAVMNIVCNLFAIFFSLFSFTIIIPFLDLIFLTSDTDYQKYYDAGSPAFSISIDFIKNYFYYHFSEIILNPEKGKTYALIFLCVLIVTMVFLRNFFRYFAMFFIAQVRNGVMRDIRNALYNKVLRLPLSYYSEEKKGDIIARMSNDAQEIEWTIMTSLEMLFRDPATIVVFLSTMVIMSPQLTLFVFILLPLTGLIIGRIGKSLKKTSAEGQKKMGLLISVFEETLSGLRIIKAFNAELFSFNSFRSLNEDYKNLMVKMYRKRDLSSPLSEFLGVLVLVAVMWFGGNLLLGSDASLSASVFIAYIAIFSQLIPPAKSFTTAYYNLQKGAASEERISEILSADIKIAEPENPVKKETFENEIEYKNISFSYGSEPVLKNLSLKIKKGETVALVGPSGGGKSTLADLLPRFYDVTSGEILIDGTLIKNISLVELRNLMGIVTQESILFNDSVFNNIAFGSPLAKTNDVVNAAKIANAHSFIEAMENGYNTNIGDRGGKLSGGQRQRISIARAIFKNPPILILDEATSALDTESEKLVQDALNNLMQNRTSLVIAHRLSTIQNADKIIVIDKGEIIQQGTHSDLLKDGGLYKKLYDLQTFD